jgi:hypothetical protein
MSNTDKLREIAEKWGWFVKTISLDNHRFELNKNPEQLLSDLTALISEDYVEKAKYDEAVRQRDELREDIEYLARRQQKAGSVSFTAERETGVSSNSIVSIAYGIVKLEDQSFPSDWSDLNACRNMWKKLPEHRKTGDALIAMERAEAAIKNTETK